MERTAGMKAFVVAYLVVLTVLVLFLLNVLGIVAVLEMEGQADSGAFAIPLAVFGMLMLVAILAAAMWPRAPRTAWFWLVGAIPGLLFFVPDIPIIIQAVTSPGSALEVLIAVAAAGGFIVLLVSAVTSFRDARQLAGREAS